MKRQTTSDNGPLDEVLLDAGDQEQGRRSFLATFFKYKRRFFFVVLLGCALAVVYASTLQPGYLSEAKLLVKQSSSEIRSQDPRLSPGGGTTRSVTRGHVLVQVDLLQSDDLLRRVVEALKAKGVFPTHDEVAAQSRQMSLGKLGAEGLRWVRKVITGRDSEEEMLSMEEMHDTHLLRYLREGLEIANRPGTDLISISFLDADRELAREIVATYVDIYIAWRREIFNRLGLVITEAEKLVAEARAERRAAEAALDSLRRENSVQDVEAELAEEEAVKVALQEERQKIELRLEEETARVARAEKEISAVDPSLPVLQPTRINPAWKVLHDQWYEATLELKTTHYSRGTPQYARLEEAVKVLRAELDRLKPEIADEGKEEINPLFASLREELIRARAARDAHTASLRRLEERLGEVSKRIRRLRDLLGPYQELVRRIEDARRRVGEQERVLADLKNDKRLDDERVRRSVDVVQQATRPMNPETSGRRKVVLMGACIAFVLALGLVGVSGLFDRSIRTAGEARGVVGEDVLAVLPDLSVRKAVRGYEHRYGARLQRRRFLDGPRRRRGGKGPEEKPPPEEGRREPDAESRAALRGLYDLSQGALTNQLDRLILELRGEVARLPGGASPIVLLGSALSGEGVSTVAFALARRMAETHGCRVLVVDWEQRKERKADAGSEPEASDPNAHALLAGVDLVKGDEVEALAGRDPGRGLLDAILECRKPEHGAIVIASPPLLSSGKSLHLLDARVLALLVVAADHTCAALTGEAAALVRSSPAVFVGTVLNRARYHVPMWLEGRT